MMQSKGSKPSSELPPTQNPFSHPSFKTWRFELVENGVPTNRFGWVTGWLHDGDADVLLDDGAPPYLVKWRQCRRLAPEEKEMPETYPIQIQRLRVGRDTAPKCVVECAFEVYDYVYGGQTLERIHERGGFHVGELLAFLYARSFSKEEWRARVFEALHSINVGAHEK